MAIFSNFVTIYNRIFHLKINNMSQINIIVAVGKNRVIGNKNKLIWKLPGDLPRFKVITTGHPIIMGRKTFESFGNKPLQNRTNIVITRNPKFKAEGCIVSSSLEEAIKVAGEIDEQIFIIGGGEIYSQSIKIADRLYLTVVDEKADGDTFFPDYSEFKRIISSEENKTPEGLRYDYVVLEK